MLGMLLDLGVARLDERDEAVELDGLPVRICYKGRRDVPIAATLAGGIERRFREEFLSGLGLGAAGRVTARGNAADAVGAGDVSPLLPYQREIGTFGDADHDSALVTGLADHFRSHRMP